LSQGGQNLAYVKPAKAGATTNLNLVTASGRVYSFVLTESGVETRLEGVRETGRVDGAESRRCQVLLSRADVETAARAEDARKEAEDSRGQIDAVAGGGGEGSPNPRSTSSDRRIPPSLRFRTVSNRISGHQRVSDLHGRAIYLRRAEPNELPALYELLDEGARHESPNLVNFPGEDGLYVVPKVLERVISRSASQRLTFRRFTDRGAR